MDKAKKEMEEKDRARGRGWMRNRNVHRAKDGNEGKYRNGESKRGRDRAGQDNFHLLIPIATLIFDL